MLSMLSFSEIQHLPLFLIEKEQRLSAVTHNILPLANFPSRERQLLLTSLRYRHDVDTASRLQVAEIGKEHIRTHSHSFLRIYRPYYQRCRKVQ